MPRDRSSQAFVIAVAVVGAGFFASTLYAERRAAAIDREVEALEVNAIPSVAHLEAARGALRDVEVEAERLARASVGQRSTMRRALLDARSRLHAEMGRELETPNYEGELTAATDARRDVAELDRLVDEWVAAPPDEGGAADEAVHATVERTDGTLKRWLMLNAEQGRDGVARIVAVRRNSMQVALGLDAACMLLAAAAAMLALRALRRSRDVETQHARLLTERADELETFAKRVAHDLLSPLSALVFSLQAFKRPAAADPALAEALRRSRACVARAQTMVDGIFEFARAGAYPGAAGHGDVRQVVDQVSEEIRGLESETEIVVEPFVSEEVACSPGVLLSIFSNLVRNAVKYMSDSSMKRVTVRVGRAGDSVRVEVEDTGPGIPSGMEQRIFDPYVRAEGLTQPGLGLGLATVKRLCEAHGGTVGVRSVPGSGAVFWFTLPRSTLASSPQLVAR